MDIRALRARRVLTLADASPAARRKELSAPLSVSEDAVIIFRNGRILGVEPYARFRRRAGIPLEDAGGVTLIPGLINAHTHLELSALRGTALLGAGFSAWVRSLPALRERPLPDKKALNAAAGEMAAHGTVHAADVNGETPVLAAGAFFGAGISADFFCESFGFGAPAASAEELRRTRLKDVPHNLRPYCALSGHALFSTDPRVLRAAFRDCRDRERPFVLHLAEHEEETACLLDGSGPLHDLLRERGVLPEEYSPPGKRPVACARDLGLLAPGTLAVHCVHCDAEEAALLARSGVTVCLCPRSNAAIGAGGVAPVEEFMRRGVPLCLGTDSLASNADLNLWNEARALRELWDLPTQALLRMMTVNAARALLRPEPGRIAPGQRAAWTTLPDDFPLTPQPKKRHAERHAHALAPQGSAGRGSAFPAGCPEPA
jgi:cytosine/adenosine deaminase-related metal-dependent hydrolase